MRRPLAWSSLVVVAAVLGCGSSSADDLFTEDRFGVVTGGSPSFGGSSSSGGAPANGGSLAGGVGGGGAGATSGGTAGATGGVPATGGSSLGGAAGKGGAGGNAGGNAGKGGAGGSAGKGGAGTGGTGGMSGKSCSEQLNALPNLLTAAQACTPSASAAPCNGFVKNQCGCMVAVNDTASTQAKAYTEAVAALLTQCGVNCEGVVCATVTAAACVTSGSGSAGSCLGR